MRKLMVLCLVAVLVAAFAPAARTDTSALMLVRVKPRSEQQAAFLMSNFDETHNHGHGAIELLLWPGDAAELDAAGIDYEVVVEDLIAHDRALGTAPKKVVELPGPDRSDYRRLDDYYSEMKKLSRKSSLVRLFKLRHKTREGRTVPALEIAANVGAKDGRPVFYIDGIHHAREWPAAEYPMIYAHHLVDRYGKDPRITNLLQRLRVIIAPIVNPDGFDYSRESPVQNSLLGIVGAEGYWRKNRRSLTGVTVPAAQKNPDAYGVDPNRNYGFMWGDSGGGSSGLFVDQTYRGDEPFSEPEAQNVRKLILSRNVTGVITNHTYGRLVLRPWGHTSKDAPDERLQERLGARIAAAMGGYQNLKGVDLYPTTGTTDDWAYAATAALGYTFEHGDAFHPPYADSVGREYKGVMEAFTIMAEAAAEPRYHSVITGRVVDEAGRALKARLEMAKPVRTPLGDGNPTGRKATREAYGASMVAPDGRFSWHLNPSTPPTARREESYRIYIRTDKGCSSRKVTVDRGERVDLGVIRVVSPICVRSGVIEVEAGP